MNTMTEWLSQFFDEVEPKEFYRGIFPEGSFQKEGEFRDPDSNDWVYNGIMVSVAKEVEEDGSQKVKKYIVRDDLDVIDQVGKTDDFCLMSPISYAGKKRTADRARFLYAFAVDLDRLKMKGDDPIGLRTLWNNHIETADRIPKPTYIVSSGTGLHLYYVLTDPVAMFKDTSRRLQDLKRDLTSLIWHDSIVDIESVKDIQQEGIYQGFRVPGTITKKGDRTRAFLTGEKITIGELTVLGEVDGDYVLRVRCSKGTYIRTLCHDIGAALGCGGVMSALRRTAVGGYRVEDAHTMDELCALPREAAQRLLLSVDSLWPDALQVTVDAKAERLARCGNPFTLSAPDGTYRIYAASGEFLLLAQVTDGTAVTIKSFFEVS